MPRSLPTIILPPCALAPQGLLPVDDPDMPTAADVVQQLCAAADDGTWVRTVDGEVWLTRHTLDNAVIGVSMGNVHDAAEVEQMQRAAALQQGIGQGGIPPHIIQG